MEKIIPEITNGRKYFNNTDLRIMVSENYTDVEGWHKHNHIDQIIYVVGGSVEVTSETGCEVLTTGKSVNIPAGEHHIVRERETNTNILVIKYISTGVNVIKDIENDYIKG